MDENCRRYGSAISGDNFPGLINKHVTVEHGPPLNSLHARTFQIKAAKTCRWAKFDQNIAKITSYGLNPRKTNRIDGRISLDRCRK